MSVKDALEDGRQANEPDASSVGGSDDQCEAAVEIYADDVKCTDLLATARQAQRLFLLHFSAFGAQGNLNQAHSSLTFAFANDIIGRIKIVPPSEQSLERRLLATQNSMIGFRRYVT